MNRIQLTTEERREIFDNGQFKDYVLENEGYRIGLTDHGELQWVIFEDTRDHSFWAFEVIVGHGDIDFEPCKGDRHDVFPVKEKVVVTRETSYYIDKEKDEKNG